MGLRRVEGCFYAQRVGPIEIIGPKGFARTREDGVVLFSGRFGGHGQSSMELL